MTEAEACIRFATWLEERMLSSGRGDALSEMEEQPSTKLWLGHLAPEAAVMERGLGERGERLSPCAIGMRFRPGHVLPVRLSCTVSMRVWLKTESRWKKTEGIR